MLHGKQKHASPQAKTCFAASQNMLRRKPKYASKR
jgi:hypothetical protein